MLASKVDIAGLNGEGRTARGNDLGLCHAGQIGEALQIKVEEAQVLVTLGRLGEVLGHAEVGAGLRAEHVVETTQTRLRTGGVVDHECTKPMTSGATQRSRNDFSAQKARKWVRTNLLVPSTPLEV